MNWQWFVLFVVVIAVLAYTNWQRSQAQVKLLQQAGFTITDDLKGQPNLLVDLPARQLAFLDAKGYQRLEFSQVESVELRFDQGKQQPENHHLYFTLAHNAPIEVHYENEWLANDQLQKVRTRLGL
ncbi:MAG: hypothetical protein ACPGF7_13505 [Pontibacterium sp.]